MERNLSMTALNNANQYTERSNPTSGKIDSRVKTETSTNETFVNSVGLQRAVSASRIKMKTEKRVVLVPVEK